MRDESPIAETPALAGRERPHGGLAPPAPDSGGRAADLLVQQWTRGIARGDRAALGELFLARADWMVQQCRAMTGQDEHFALDILQDAMLRIARRMSPLSSQLELDRYLRSVIRTASIDRIRADLRRIRRERAVPKSDGVSPPAIDDIAELERIMAALSDTQRDTLLRRIARELGFAAMAEQDGSSPAVTQGRFRRLIESIRTQTHTQPTKPTKGQAKS